MDAYYLIRPGEVAKRRIASPSGGEPGARIPAQRGRTSEFVDACPPVFPAVRTRTRGGRDLIANYEAGSDFTIPISLPAGSRKVANVTMFGITVTS